MSDKPTESEEVRTRPFADFLQDHNAGAQHLKAGEALQRVVGAVLDTGKAGSVTIKVSVSPMKNTDDALLTTVEVAEKVPTDPPKGAVFYADVDHNLTRDNPQQLQFDSIKEVPSAPEVRELPVREREVR